jgi:hypothetical protein
MLKIGITFDPPNSPIEMFNNGIKQNAFYLLELLINCGYDAQLIIAPGKYDKVENLYGCDTGRYKWEKYENIVSAKFDIVIQVIFQIPDEIVKELKQSGTKLVVYCCGNEYVVMMERALYGGELNANIQHSREKIFDQVWTIPQHTNTNFYYWKILLRTEVIEVPFIWSPISVQQIEKENIEKFSTNFEYQKRDKKKVAIFEPNLDVVKWFFPALLVCDSSYRLDKSIEHVYLTNLANKKEPFSLDLVNKLVKSLDLFVDNKLSIESRFNTLYFMSKYADVVVSHQWENPLNYLYLDLAWYGWPVVHNAHLCADIGYYYDGFNYEQGGKILSDVIRNHDKNVQKYTDKNRKLIERYLPTNINLQNKYKKLVENLMNIK